MSGNQLKLIALISMLLDHIGAVLIGQVPSLTYAYGSWYMPLRIIGRISFPIFAFLLAEGFIHTRNIRKYFSRLFIFALLSEIPFDLAVYGTAFSPEGQNILFSFCIAVLMLYLIAQEAFPLWARALSVLAAALLAHFIRSDYSFWAVLLVLIFYLLRRQKLWRTAASALLLLGLQSPAPLALIPIHFYNGQPGRLRMKYCFYLFYPAHLLLLYSIKSLILGY